LVECWVVEESGVKVVFRALRRSGHYAVTNGMRTPKFKWGKKHQDPDQSY
jgi:hypothetical protein